jgi:cob(I)alamin adenosyltransferase
VLQVYTGDGKGKTTAALGLACRAAGHGLRVLFVQFMKASVTRGGEFRTLSGMPGVRIERYGDSLLDRRADAEEISRAIREGLAEVRGVLERGDADLIVLDEANVAISRGLVSSAEVLAAVAAAGPDVEIVMTGRDAPADIVDQADLVTEMAARKHPFDRGVPARRGIEF